MGWLRRVTLVCDACLRMQTPPITLLEDAHKVTRAREIYRWEVRRVEGVQYDLCLDCVTYSPTPDHLDGVLERGEHIKWVVVDEPPRWEAVPLEHARSHLLDQDREEGNAERYAPG